jgi:hypothetical protein
MESLLADKEFMTALIAVALGLLGAAKVPAWSITLIAELAPIVVKFIEQTMKNESNDKKKSEAIKGVKERLPVVLRALPGIDKRVEAAVEAAVTLLPATGKLRPTAPTLGDMKAMAGAGSRAFGGK